MKKRIFSLLAAALFTGSISAMKDNIEDPDGDYVCAKMAFTAQVEHEKAGLPKHIANELASELYDDCIGS